MIWGTFGKIHFATMIVAVILNVALFIYLKNKSRRTQILLLFAISILGLSSIAYNLLAGGSRCENLPLHLYSLNALLLPLAVLTRRKWICNLSLFWSVGACVALLFNYSMAATPIFSLRFALHYLTLVIGAGVPIILFALDLVEREYKYIASTLFVTGLVYTAVHTVNVAINSAGFIGANGEIFHANYLYSVTPTNPLLNFFYLLIPSPYWYMILTVPFILLYLFWWYLPEMLEARRKSKRVREKMRLINKYYDEYLDEYVDEIIEEKFDTD